MACGGPAVEAAGIRSDFKMHDLRKQFCSILLKQGRSVAFMKSVMGHRSASTSLKYYAGVFTDEAERSAKDVDEWLSQESRDSACQAPLMAVS